MKQQILAFLLLACISIPAVSQSPRAVLVEHFTNTRCSICASKNPAFYQTLSGYPQILHIAFHPSSPYSQCQFSLQNPTENDSRTKYYGVYGATPQIVVNGKVQPPSTPLINSSTITQALQATSPIEILTIEKQISADSIFVTIVVKTTDVHSLSNLRLFAGVAENPVNYSAPNGEKIHHDVFRKALTAIAGNPIQLPSLKDSIVINFGYTIKNDWNSKNVYTIAYIQREDTKEVLNASKSTRIGSNPNSVLEDMETNISITPNPVGNQLQITSAFLSIESAYSIYDALGSKVDEGVLTTSTLDVSFLSTGIYYLHFNQLTQKFIKE